MSERRKDRLSLQHEAARTDPEQQAVDNDLKRVLEAAVLELPATYRTVVVLRDVEGLSTAEAADCLDVEPGALKTRLSRAHALLRKRLRARSSDVLRGTFAFDAVRCDRVVAAVFARIAQEPGYPQWNPAN